MDNGKMLPQLSAIILEEQTGLTLTEVCQACAVRVEFIVELVDEGVLDPHRPGTASLALHRHPPAPRHGGPAPAARSRRQSGRCRAGAAVAR